MGWESTEIRVSCCRGGPGADALEQAGAGWRHRAGQGPSTPDTAPGRPGAVAGREALPWGCVAVCDGGVGGGKGLVYGVAHVGSNKRGRQGHLARPSRRPGGAGERAKTEGTLGCCLCRPPPWPPPPAADHGPVVVGWSAPWGGAGRGCAGPGGCIINAT